MTAGASGVRLRDAGIRLDAMPAAGRDLRLSVGDEERAALAEQLKVTAIEQLEVQLHAVKFRGGLRVTGRLAAMVVQPSVVSLDPVRQAVDEPVDRVFLPVGKRTDVSGVEIFLDPEEEDVPDYFEGAEADLSDLIAETLALAIDPYPRAEGESVADIGLDAPQDEASPFAALKSLKLGGDKG